MQCVLGVDGGNTKTIALVAALDGRILGAGRGGCGDIYNARSAGKTSEEAALANIEEAITGALRQASVQSSDLVASVFNMAGADWPEDLALLQSAMQARGFGRSILVQNDALGVLHDQVSSSTGVSVVCGTGGAVGARASDGRTWHSSHWQDEVQGSHQLGQETLFALCRAELGIDPPTTLTRRVLDVLHVRSAGEALHLFTSRNSRPHRDLSHLTPILLDEAQAGDEVATRIVEHHGRLLGQFALAAARHVGIEGTSFALVFAGGVFRHPSPLLAEIVTQTVRAASPLAHPMRCRFEPIVGVLFSALEAAGVVINEPLIAKLLATLPSAALFSTAPEEAFVVSPEGEA
ncbi:MAG TPA: BadF/BadG/BcrA/BcrD ATPase family protein [Ktedonobacterales bacterium]|nr:BadF/BadG/BcrA/BcrD ATPase family protein [Ktedonobacterales bacterium]